MTEQQHLLRQGERTKRGRFLAPRNGGRDAPALSKGVGVP